MVYDVDGASIIQALKIQVERNQKPTTIAGSAVCTIVLLALGYAVVVALMCM